MDNIIVSFCIATFQRYEILVELIQEILMVDSDKFEIIVCDDKSLDESVVKLKKIKDNRLKIYVNKENVGSLLNIHESLNKGQGKYLFYINDRDNIDNFKIKKLIDILEDFEKKNIAFAKCVSGQCGVEKYRIFDEGEESLIKFACRIDHPTGYIFNKNIWRKIRNKRQLFENQKYGDYVITQICAIMAKNYKGALIYGDVCDLKRYRIDFSKVKSGYYNKRKDKRLWYTPEVILRELKIGQKFLKKIGINDNIIKKILVERYSEYLPWCISEYKNIISDPVCTEHYNIYPSQNFIRLFLSIMVNGINLHKKVILMYPDDEYCDLIKKITRKEYMNFFRKLFIDNVHVMCKTYEELIKKDKEIYKREEILKTYERWVENLLMEQIISEYLISNDFRKVAIYGMGRVGRQLYKEFEKTSIHVEYVIDQNVSQVNEYVSCSCYDMTHTFPNVDIIIVTVSSEAENIVQKLREKVKCQIKAMNDILFVMS